MTAVFWRAQTTSRSLKARLLWLKYLSVLFAIAASATLLAADGGGLAFLAGAVLSLIVLAALGLLAVRLMLSLVLKYPRG